MHLDFSILSQPNRYKLLASLIVPRPIALVTSLNSSGSVNAAPFSFFNCMGSDPALIFLSIRARDAAPHTTLDIKDTSLNIATSKEFVVNLVDEDLVQAMNICAVDFPSEESEIAAAKLELAPSKIIRTPRIAASPASFECREHSRLEIGANRILIGEVVGLNIRDELLNLEKFHVDTAALHLVGRMGGAGGYTRTRDAFEIPRMTYEEWLKEND